MILSDLNIIAQIGASVATIITLFILLFQYLKDKTNINKKIYLYNRNSVLNVIQNEEEKNILKYNISIYNQTKFPLRITNINLYIYYKNKISSTVILSFYDEVKIIKPESSEDYNFKVSYPSILKERLIEKLNRNINSIPSLYLKADLVIDYYYNNKIYASHINFGIINSYFEFSEQSRKSIEKESNITEQSEGKKIVAFTTAELLEILDINNINYNVQYNQFDLLNIKKCKYSKRNYNLYKQQQGGLRKDAGKWNMFKAKILDILFPDYYSRNYKYFLKDCD
jgi:hypothetical protein